ncbi:MAG: hypothetical protein IT342_25325 [Candidatus Melainabacteria bacterium]|nr:hypothetical protein [Candidatus Melainabacteria bacterium]
MKSLTAVLAGILLLLAFPFVTWALQSRLSAVVALVYRGQAIENFLKRPAVSYVETYFLFEPDLADDVIFGVDQELIDGIGSPIYTKGGDWMAFVGLQRSGIVWIAEGTDATMRGAPSKERKWKIQKLNRELVPNTWYRLRCYADFRTRQYVSIELDGANLQERINLSGLRLDYPNYMPFDKRAMSYYVYAMRGRTMMKNRGVPRVYFDDVVGGIIEAGRERRVFVHDFESQTAISEQPAPGPVIDLNKYEQGRFYFERKESRFCVERVRFARSGRNAGVADADL